MAKAKKEEHPKAANPLRDLVVNFDLDALREQLDKVAALKETLQDIDMSVRGVLTGLNGTDPMVGAE